MFEKKDKAGRCIAAGAFSHTENATQVCAFPASTQRHAISFPSTAGASPAALPGDRERAAAAG